MNAEALKEVIKHKLPGLQALNLMLTVKRGVLRYGGDLTLLWHNWHFNPPNGLMALKRRVSDLLRQSEKAIRMASALESGAGDPPISASGEEGAKRLPSIS